MNWTQDKSVTLSQICVILFAVLLLAVDIFAYPFLEQRCNTALFYDTAKQEFPGGTLHWQEAFQLLIGIYLSSIFAWGVLLHLWKLLRHIKKGEIFDDLVVKYLRAVSWCCTGAAVICAITGILFPLLLVFAAAGGFMALIVRIVKNAFQQAVEMKYELDLTI